MYKKANSRLAIISRVRKYITMETASEIYKKMVSPNLEYIDYMIESGSQDNVMKLDKLRFWKGL